MPSPPPMPGNQQPQFPPRPQQFPQQQFPQQQFPQQQQYPPQFQPQGPGMYPGMQPQPRKSNVGKIILGVVGGLVVLVILLFVVLANLGDPSTPTPGPNSGPVAKVGSVGVPVITDQVDEESQEPQRDLKGVVPASTDTIYAAIQVKLAKGSVLSAKWYYNGNQQTHLDTKLDVPDDFEGWAAFNIGNGGKPWPAGNFKVEIYVDGQLKQSKDFQVR